MSVGAYATLAAAKARIFGPSYTSTSDQDSVLTDICNEVNDFIESFTQRVLAPFPTYSSTFTGSAGASSGTVASASGLAVGDDLLIGLITGTHEALEVLAVSGTTVTFRTALISAYAGAPIQRIVVQDGFDATQGQDGLYGRVFGYRLGIVTLAALETATFTGGPFSRIPQQDYFLRPSPPDPGWPFTLIEMTNIPTPGNTSPNFYPGFDNVRLIGPGPCVGLSDAAAFGWPAIPDVITGVALNIVAGRYQMRASGGTYEVAVGSDQVQVGTFLISRSDYNTLWRYRVKSLEAI